MAKRMKIDDLGGYIFENVRDNASNITW